MFAYTNVEVDALNAELRAVRKARGELGADVRFETRHGVADFAVGDRVQVTETLREARLWNGNAGVITGIDAETGRISARLDGVGEEKGREVSWRAAEFTGFRHGYAGTIYKGQGKTLDHTYLLHSAHWRQAASYVALTRQRESARIFAATQTATDLAPAGPADEPRRGAGGLGRLGHAGGAAGGAAAGGRRKRGGGAAEPEGGEGRPRRTGR